jgi:hypothetical protein
MSAVFDHFEKDLQKDMIRVLSAAKSIQVQLISATQRESILSACKELAERYKTIKSLLGKGFVFPLFPFVFIEILAFLVQCRSLTVSLTNRSGGRICISILFGSVVGKVRPRCDRVDGHRSHDVPQRIAAQ